MKILISKYQYELLIESNSEKNKNLVGKMWDEGMDIDEISELIGMSKTDIILHLKDKHIKIDCGFAEKLTNLLFWKTNLINKEYSFDDGESTLKFIWGGFSGIVYFVYENKEIKLTGMASPYWNGDCYVPVDTDHFLNKLDGEEDDANFSDMTLNNVPSEFNSIQELIDFLNNDYPKELIKKMPDIISLYV